MRSRYTAYATKNVDYIFATHDPETRGELDRAETQSWTDRTEWLSLDIRATKRGGAQDSDGEVEFAAHFKDERGRELLHHELSTFVKRDGRWFFHDGAAPKAPPVVAGPKIGRNDPCTCGSGKKYKKCHGANA